MKRFIALILSLSMLLSLVSLSGCSKVEEPGVTMGQWLSMVNDAFGMDSYVQEDPYFSNIGKDNAFFEEVQIAAEWDVINVSQKISVDENTTWKDVLISLVNAGEFTSIDASEEEKIDCAIDTFDSSIRKYWMNREIKCSNAIVLLATAQRLWAKKTYGERVEVVKFKEGVKDFSENKDVAENYVIDGNTTILSAASDVDLKAGDVYVLPTSEKSIGTKVYKVDSVSEKNGKVYIKNSDDIDLYDIAEDIFLQETLEPTAQNTVFYDANGKVLSNDTAVAVPQSHMGAKPKIVNLLAKTSPAVQNVADWKAKHEFKVGEWTVSVSYKLDGSLDLDVSVSKSVKDEWEWEVGVGLDNVKVTNEIDYSWFKLKSASVRVDYETSLSFKASKDDTPVNKVFAPYNNGNGKGLTNLKKAAFKDAQKAGGSGAQTVKLFSMDIWSVGVARVCLDVNFIVKVDGSFEIKITNHDSKGIEYKNKNIRFINTSDKDIDISAEAKIEATLGIGPALYTIGLKKPIIGVQGKFGAGAKASIVLHLADSENHLIEEASAEDYPPEVYKMLMDADIATDAESIRRAAEAQGGTYSTEVSGELKLHADVCINIALYWIIRLEITDTSYAAELLGGKITLSKEFLGEKNGKFGYVHIENFDFISGFSKAVFGSAAASADQCTKEYKAFDEAEESKDEGDDTQNDNEAIIQGEQIVLSEMRASIAVGQKYYMIVQQIPKGYDVKDLKMKVANTEIASVDENGVIIGKKSGSTVVTVYTSDNKFSAYCALMVTDDTKIELEPLSVLV